MEQHHWNIMLPELSKMYHGELINFHVVSVPNSLISTNSKDIYFRDKFYLFWSIMLEEMVRRYYIPHNVFHMLNVQSLHTSVQPGAKGFQVDLGLPWEILVIQKLYPSQIRYQYTYLFSSS